MTDLVKVHSDQPDGIPKTFTTYSSNDFGLCVFRFRYHAANATIANSGQNPSETLNIWGQNRTWMGRRLTAGFSEVAGNVLHV